jgi:hypothetical protein
MGYLVPQNAKYCSNPDILWNLHATLIAAVHTATFKFVTGQLSGNCRRITYYNFQWMEGSS